MAKQSARVGRAEWQRRLEACNASGLSPRKYAEREGFNAETFRWWRGLFRAEAKSKTRPKKASFVEVNPSNVAVSSFEIVLVSGVVLRVSSGFDGAELRRLVDVMERA